MLDQSGRRATGSEIGHREGGDKNPGPDLKVGHFAVSTAGETEFGRILFMVAGVELCFSCFTLSGALSLGLRQRKRQSTVKS